MTETGFADKVTRVRAAYGYCFGCGPDNPIGLQLDGFAPDGPDAITATFTARDDFRGFADVLHGGIVAAALDETLAWTAILLADAMTVTAKLDLRYRKSAAPGATVTTRGRLVENRGRRLVMEASASVDGQVVAEAAGLFVTVDGLPPHPAEVGD